MATYQTIAFKDLIKGAYFDAQRLKIYTDAAYTLPVDLTGCVISCRLRQTEKSSPKEIWTTENGTITITGADDNFVNLLGRNINADAGQYYMDLDILFPSGINRTWLRIMWKIVAPY